jgi:hypothetical protein
MNTLLPALENIIYLRDKNIVKYIQYIYICMKCKLDEKFNLTKFEADPIFKTL